MDEHTEGATELVGMREGLKLARLFGGECPAGNGPTGAQDSGEKIRLRNAGFSLEPLTFAGPLQGAEINVGGDVLFTGRRQHVVHQLVLPVGPQGSVGALRREEFLREQSVIERDEQATIERHRGLFPPVDGRRAKLGLESVRQHVAKLRRQIGPEKFPVQLQPAASGCGSIVLDLRTQRQFDPFEGIRRTAHPELAPSPIGLPPAQAVDGKGVEEFVGEYHAVQLLSRVVAK